MNKLDKFGEIFINEVMDNTIDCYKKMLYGNMRGLTAQEVQKRFLECSEKEKEELMWIINKVVEDCMHNMLFMMEEHEEIELKFEGDNLVEESDGLSGELYTEDGWIERFSETI